MSDLAVLGFLAILGPVLLFGLVANIALWCDKPLSYDDAYERRQREDRRWKATQARQARRAAKRIG